MYSFNFKYDDYYDSFKYITTLYIYQDKSYIPLDNCTQISYKELICVIIKENLEENLVLYEDVKFKLAFIHENLGSMFCDNVFDIKINYIPKEMEIIYLEITSLLNNVS